MKFVTLGLQTRGMLCLQLMLKYFKLIITVDRILENLFFIFQVTNEIYNCSFTINQNISFCIFPYFLFLRFGYICKWMSLYQWLLTKYKFHNMHYKVYSVIGCKFKETIAKIISILFGQQMAVFLSWWIQLPVSYQIWSLGFEI